MNWNEKNDGENRNDATTYTDSSEYVRQNTHLVSNKYACVYIDNKGEKWTMKWNRRFHAKIFYVKILQNKLVGKTEKMDSKKLTKTLRWTFIEQRSDNVKNHPDKWAALLSSVNQRQSVSQCYYGRLYNIHTSHHTKRTNISNWIQSSNSISKWIQNFAWKKNIRGEIFV